MTLINIKRYNDIDEFLQETREHLLVEEALNTFVFVTANKLQATKPDTSSYYCSAIWNETRLVVCVIGLRDEVLYISTLYDPEQKEAAELLAKEAFASEMNFKHIHGYYPIVDQVATLVVKESENKWSIKERNAWGYVIDKVIWSERNMELAKHGELRPGTTEDIPLLQKMAYHFIEGIGESSNVTKEETDKLVQEALNMNDVYLWATKEEGPVGMAWSRRPLLKGISVAYVATLPEYRHKGYASVMVSTLTEKLLKSYEYATLFALIEQDPQDNLYTRIGYRYIGKAGMPKLIRS